eukprot:7063502-Karenia_brevis.AAC.1
MLKKAVEYLRDCRPSERSKKAGKGPAPMEIDEIQEKECWGGDEGSNKVESWPAEPTDQSAY